MYAPLSLNVTVTLTFDLETQNSSTSHDQPPCQVRRYLGYGFSSYSLVIDWTRFVYGRTDRPTDMCKALYSSFFEGGHNKIKK